MPAWIPDPVRWYLDHTESGTSIRAVARAAGRNPSTVLRQVRRLETLRDDDLTDAALTRLGRGLFQTTNHKEAEPMTAPIRNLTDTLDDKTLEKEARRVLRRLCETGAQLAIAPDLERAVVVKQVGEADPVRIAVVARPVVEAFALKEWISSESKGRIVTYRITQTGRAALKRMLARENSNGFAEAAMPFADQHRDWGTRVISDPDENGPRSVRANLSESPLALLARRKDKDGKPFLSPELVSAGERLREDFELAQMGPRVAQNWDRFLTAGDRGGFGHDGPANGPSSARDRVTNALRDLGPGLGDVVLRCCCFLEGMEAAEKRMGWSARSGKIVLRIALQRLHRHYAELNDPRANMIG